MKKFLFSILFAALLLPLAARMVYVTRHGQVGDKKDRIILTGGKKASEIKLTALGIEQAKMLADYLVKEKKFNGSIYVSPLYRTIETGTYTAALLNKKVILAPGIQEIARTKTPRGMTLAEIEKYFAGKFTAPAGFEDNWRLSNEDNKARQNRVNAALDKILAESQGDLLFVSHGGTVGNIVRYFNAKCAKGVAKTRGTVWNCSLHAFALDDNGKVVKGYYTTEYMPDAKVTSNFRTPKIPRPDDPKYEMPKNAPKKKAPAAVRQNGERLILVTRHCQATNAARPDLIRPVPDDTGITELGITQSRQLGKAVKELGFKGMIFTSPLFRTTATGCEAAKVCGAKVYPDALVQQRVKRVGGNLAKGGATLAKFRELFPDAIAADAKLADDWMLKTKERYEVELYARLNKHLDQVLAAYPDQDIMIVTHGGAVSQYLRIMKDRCKLPKKIKDTVWNCALFKFAIDKNGNYRYLGYDISFMNEDQVTSNLGSSLKQQNEQKKSGKNSKKNMDFL
ncbi:MAG: histidine phosphatase family protein [Lentisphaeria bacterium]|nr:histidine phosphatase family protein [Lentisphaeria bacterium]